MITPTRESLDAFRPEYDPHPAPRDEEPMPRGASRWAKTLGVLAVLAVIIAVIARLTR